MQRISDEYTAQFQVAARATDRGSLTAPRLHDDHFDVVVDALQQQLALVVDDLAALRRAQRAHQRLEQVRTLVVIEQRAEVHPTYTARTRTVS